MLFIVWKIAETLGLLYATFRICVRFVDLIKDY